MNNDSLIKEALNAYGIKKSEYEVIGHNKNITCKVMCNVEKYVLSEYFSGVASLY